MTLPAGAREVTRVGGGNINEAFSVTLDGARAFVKTRAEAAPGEYAAEATGLQWLAEPGVLRTPRVLELDEHYLALEWIPGGSLDDAGAEELGRGLAATHAAYEELAPLADGWRERVELYQLLPLLVHALLFGGSYAGAAERAARRYA